MHEIERCFALAARSYFLRRRASIPEHRLRGSKFAVIGLKTAALEFAKDGIRVNSVSPGPIQTEMFDRAFGEGQTDMKKAIEAQNPTGRVGMPEEIAGAVLWLCSPDAAFTTGQDIIIDGGFTAQ